MKAKTQWLNEFSPDLFWDVWRDAVDPEKNRRGLVERVVVGTGSILRGRIGQRLCKESNL